MIGIQFTGVVRVLRSAAALQQAHTAPADSVVVQSPLPGGVARVVRFLLNTVPQWVQIGGVVVAAAVAASILWFLFTLRVAIRAWLTRRTSSVKRNVAGTPTK